MKRGQKALSLFAVVALLATMLSVIPVATVGAEGDDLVTNGGFEDGMNGWSTERPGNWGVETGYYHSGSKSVYGTNASYYPLYQALTVESGKSYEITVYIKSQYNSKFGVTVLEGVGDHVNDVSSLGGAYPYYVGQKELTGTSADYDSKLGTEFNVLGCHFHTGTYDWEKVTFTIEPTQSTVVLALSSCAGIGIYTWFDDISVTEYVEPVVEVVNGGFEDGLEGWSTERPGNWGVETGYYHSGSKSVYGTSNSYYPLYQALTVEPGKSYEITAYIKSQYNSKFGVTVLEGVGDHVNDVSSLGGAYPYYVGQKELTGTSADYDSKHGTEFNVLGCHFHTGTYDWEKVTFTIEPTQSTVVLALSSCAGAGIYTWFDDISVTEYVEPVVEVVNGGFEDGLDGWSTARPGNWGVETGYYHSGSQSVYGTNQSYYSLYQALTVEPGKSYEITVHVKSQAASKFGVAVLEGVGDSVNDTARLGETMAYYVWQEKFVGGSQDYAASIGQNNGFNELGCEYYTGGYDWLEVTFTIKPTQSTVVLALGSCAGIGIYTWFDDISIELRTDIAIVGTQLNSKLDALRFKFTMDAQGVTMDEAHVRNELTDAKVFIEGVERKVTDFGVMLNVSGNPSEADLSVGTTNTSSDQIPALKLTSIDGNTVVFVARLNVPEDYYAREVHARAYIAYEDENGAPQYYYTDTIVDSIETVKRKLGITEDPIGGDGKLHVQDGELYQPTTGKYNDYIKYRDTLGNTYKKLTGDKKLKVVYFGGSVTNGTGATDRDATSWRALIGAWLKDTFPNAEVTNLNRATGESGTYLGSYRFERDVVAANPDLVFIEYSINDLYSGNTYAQAAYQYEAIVRGIREQLPQCDIVTVLVTDQSRANGQLHEQAQAHEDVSIAYRIPTVHVGRALATQLLNNAGSEQWSNYMTDIVHPNDKGYSFYYEVIKEFMTACLVDYNHSGDATNHTVPDQQCDILHNGNVTVIEPTAAVISRSEELGGKGFVVKDEPYGLDNYNSYFFSNGTNDEIVIEFNGTELVMLDFALNITSMQIKIDDGQYTTKTLTGIHDLALNPIILVTGLSSGEHTVHMKPVNPSGGGSIKIAAFYSRDAEKASRK